MLHFKIHSCKLYNFILPTPPDTYYLPNRRCIIFAGRYTVFCYPRLHLPQHVAEQWMRVSSTLYLTQQAIHTDASKNGKHMNIALAYTGNRVNAWRRAIDTKSRCEKILFLFLHPASYVNRNREIDQAQRRNLRLNLRKKIGKFTFYSFFFLYNFAIIFCIYYM